MKRRIPLVIASSLALSLSLALAGPPQAAATPTPPAPPAEPTVNGAEISRLEARLDALLAAKDGTKALAAAKELADTAEWLWSEKLYRVAAIEASLGNREEAYTALQKALDAGFWDMKRARTDDEFKDIRGEERFVTMLKKARLRQYMAMLERPERETFQKPAEVMTALALKPGERVADVGAGTGYFTLRVARAVGPTGTVHAIDIVQDLLDHVAARASAEGLANITYRKVPSDDPQLTPAGFDTVLMVDTIHYVKDRAAYSRKLHAGIAPGGRLVVIDYIPKPYEERPWGPPPEQQMSKETLDAEMAAGGLVPTRVHTFLPEQYFVEYQRIEDVKR